MAKLLFKPISILIGMAAGALGSVVFEYVWGLIREGEAPAEDERDASWGEVLLSAAVSGAIFATARALVRRGGAKGFEKATGVWPGSTTSTES